MSYHEREIRPEPPTSIEAEQALLGAIMIDNASYWRVAGILQPKHFSEPLHREVYEVAGKMIAEGRAANPVTMKQYLPENFKIGELTLKEYLMRLSLEAVGSFHAYDNARVILERWSRQELVNLAYDLRDMSVNMPVDMTPEKLIGMASDRLTEIAQEGNERAGSMKYGVLLPKAIDRVAKDSLNGNKLIPWFLPEITQAVGDIRHGNLVGFMSDSGGGKTSFSLTQCRHAALAGYRTAFFSIEITDEEAALQAAAQASRISLDRLDAFALNSTEKERIEGEMMKSTNIPFDIVSFAECSLSDIRIKMEAMKKSVGLDLVFIDHAKMIQLPGKAGEIFAERVNALYRGLKAIAKSLDVAIVILIQRNDEWKARWKTGGSLRPMMGDAYGGGGVKQNLDVWFSLYRPEPLYKELIPQEYRQEKRDDLVRRYEGSKGKAWIINHKRRRGEPGQSAEIEFEAEFTLFKSGTPEMPAAFEGFLQ